MIFTFGVLPEPLRAKMQEWIIEPSADYKNIIQNWQKIGTDKEWVYPPIYSYAERIPGTTKVRKIPNSLKQDVLWKLPTTHELVYTGRRRTFPKIEDMATFIIYLVGLAHGVQLQHTSKGWLV